MREEKLKTPNPKSTDLNQKNIEDLQNKCQEYLNGWKRAKADYENLKKETGKKQEEFIDYIQAALLLEILPIINNYKVALSHVPENLKKEEWLQGFNHIYKQFKEFLKKIGIKEIKTVGEKFNLEFHEAVAQEEKDDVEDQIILKEASPGFQLNDKVIIPAKVVVNVKNK